MQLSLSLPFALGIDFDMQAVGEKQGETHTAYGTCRPMQFKISLTVETCYEKMRRWLTVGCQLGCLATTNGSMVTHRFLSLPLPLVTPTPSLPSPPFLRMEQRSGEKLRLLLHEQYQHQISMQWFFFFFARSVKCSMESIIITSSSSKCRCCRWLHGA